MTLDELINLAYQTATGKNKTLTPDNARYERLKMIANMMQDAWQNEPHTVWGSLAEDVEIGKIEQGKTVYDFAKNGIRKIDKRQPVFLKIKNKAVTSFDWLAVGKIADGYCGVVLDGKRLKFYGLPSSLEGASVVVRGCLDLPKLESPEDVIKIDDPYWLVYMTAAEFVRNSRTKGGQYGNLIAMAQNSMDGMQERNNFSSSEIEREGVFL